MNICIGDEIKLIDDFDSVEGFICSSEMKELEGETIIVDTITVTAEDDKSGHPIPINLIENIKDKREELKNETKNLNEIIDELDEDNDKIRAERNDLIKKNKELEAENKELKTNQKKRLTTKERATISQKEIKFKDENKRLKAIIKELADLI